MNAIVTVMGWLSVFPQEIQDFVVAWKNLSVDELLALDEHEFERRQQVRETVRVLDALEGFFRSSGRAAIAFSTGSTGRICLDCLMVLGLANSCLLVLPIRGLVQMSVA